MKPNPEAMSDLERRWKELFRQMSGPAAARASARLFGPNTALAEWFRLQRLDQVEPKNPGPGVIV
jgi:hypothetical protein